MVYRDKATGATVQYKHDVVAPSVKERYDQDTGIVYYVEDGEWVLDKEEQAWENLMQEVGV